MPLLETVLAYATPAERRTWIFEQTHAAGWPAITIIRNLNMCIKQLLDDINRPNHRDHQLILKHIAEVSEDINWFCSLPSTRL